MSHNYNAPRRTTQASNSPIAEARLAKGWTQQQLGEAIGVDKSQIHKWESGRRNPKLDAIMRLAEVLGVDWQTLLPKR